MFNKYLQRPDFGLLLLRLGAGSFMLTHGWPKFQKILGGDWTFADPIGIGQAPSLALATFAELLCSLLVIAGYRVRLAVMPLIFTMLVAAVVVHSADPWPKKELPLLYATAFLALLFLGGGKISVDGLLAKPGQSAD